MPQDELAAGLSGQPESIQPQTLLAQVLDRANLQRAVKQMRQNKGAPGIDGMTVDELPKYLRDHWLEIRAQLEAGKYQPQPVKRVEIPKPDGKTRPLGIPTVLDRFIQQSIAHVISAQWEPHFHRHSYGFHPQILLEPEFAGSLGKRQAREIVRLRVLLPVDEMPGWRDAQRVGEHRGARMRRGPQPDDLRPEATGVMTVRYCLVCRRKSALLSPLNLPNVAGRGEGARHVIAGSVLERWRRSTPCSSPVNMAATGYRSPIAACFGPIVPYSVPTVLMIPVRWSWQGRCPEPSRRRL